MKITVNGIEIPNVRDGITIVADGSDGDSEVGGCTLRIVGGLRINGITIVGADRLEIITECIGIVASIGV